MIRQDHASAARHGRGLWLSRGGDWFHDGVAVQHARLSALLTRSIARDAEDRLWVTTGRGGMHFVAEDAPLQVRSVREGTEALVLLLSDAREEPLEPNTEVWIDAAGVVRSPVREGTFWARWSRSATQAFLARLSDDGSALALPRGRAEVRDASAQRMDWSALPRGAHRGVRERGDAQT